jgi:hypothetical protein
MQKMGRPGNLAKWTNHFKNGMPWLGNSTYSENYKEPVLDQYSKIQVV